MPDQTEEGDPTTAKNPVEPPKLRFVTARPDSTQARREAKSVIRAHASRASWAKIRQGKKQSRQEGSSQIGSIQPPAVQQTPLANTGLVSSQSNDEQDQDTCFGGAGPSGSRQVVPSRRQTILGSHPVPSPLHTVGAGDIDPFASYPSRLPREIAAPIIAQVNHYFNIMFLPEPDGMEESVARHWISWFMSDSTLFHALCFGQLARLSVTEASGLNPVSQRAKWYCYSVVVGEVNRRFSNASTRCSDESILAVQALAFHGDKTAAHDTREPPYSPSQGPLNALQGLDTYAGRLDPVHMHVHGLAKMLAMRGGVDDIKFPGLAAMLSYGDVILASRLLQRPTLPFVPIGESPERTLASVKRPGHPLAQLGSGFQMLYDLVPPEMAQQLYNVLLHLSTYLLAVEDYIMGRPQAQSMLTLADQRNFVQHSLMSMHSSPGATTTTSADDGMYSLQQATWCAGVVSSLISVFPIPPARAPFAKLASQIRQHLIISTSSGGGHDGKGWRKGAPLMLWITFMGALASTAEDKTWYISVLERLVHRMQILSWQSLKEKLLNFLWFPTTSDIDGQRLWREIHNSNPFR
ncbi:uncharacterized protein Z520_03063 [Fonsecaea multimorphosa CBS 102226]|uniref:Transcription factor domain-containing protein n=1 Tax=Fonsecaea multimorphosa CBS 102226 TaxID=1442371 RepID=A0A0D2HHY2_9EURO|nr:uncharacterized protein Z520_03063 [Fonsecaea multimorphosa CBS 102226]KIY01511.1 hypothetical protein Z520_03063 [Fonsecaea multimorphosa CBS 102226]OAL28271.1 hypothetical protein AYO22_02977 [Fonsecaea multimorphosa]